MTDKVEPRREFPEHRVFAFNGSQRRRRVLVWDCFLSASVVTSDTRQKPERASARPIAKRDSCRTSSGHTDLLGRRE